MKHKILIFTTLLITYTMYVGAQTSNYKNPFDKSEKAEFRTKITKTKIPWIKNIGQQNEDIAYYAKIFAGTTFVTRDGDIVYNLPVDNNSSYCLRERFHKTSQVWKTFEVWGENPSQTKVNYFIGNDKTKWHSNIPNYQTINMGEVWEGIEVKLNAYKSNIEKLFYVKPGSNPKDIKLEISGAKRLKIDREGRLHIITKVGIVELTKPVAYQYIDGEKIIVHVDYNKKGLIYGFTVGDHDLNHTLVIDPLIASTFAGGILEDQGEDIVMDKAGNFIVTGWTNSTNYPISGTFYDSSLNGNLDVIVSKFSNDLSTLLASTFIGGSNSDICVSIVLDDSGYVFLSGYTNSGDYPTVNTSYDTSHNGANDIFVTKLSNDISTLVASTFIGGTSSEGSESIKIDGSGNIFIIGTTSSIDFPTTALCYDSSYNGGMFGGFISKFDNNLSNLLASTFFLGESSTILYSFTIDDTGNVYLTGGTDNDLPTTSLSYDSSYNGTGDVFVCKLSNDLNSLIASTYIGGSLNDRGKAIQLDSFGNIFIAGETQSSEFPIVGTAFSDSMRGFKDIFIAKLDNDLNILMSSTFIGGRSGETIQASIIDSEGNIVFTGSTASDDYPCSSRAYDKTLSRGGNIIISKMSNDLSTLLASTLFGGDFSESAQSLIIDEFGNIVVTGSTRSTDFQFAKNSFDSSFNGSTDLFIIKLDKDLSVELPNISVQPFNDTVCEGNNLNFIVRASNADSFQWQVNSGGFYTDLIDGNNVYGALKDELTIIDVATSLNGYKYRCITANDSGSVISQEAILTVYPSFQQILNDSICQGDSIEWRGIFLDTTGYYFDSFTTTKGCDSIYSFNLKVNPVPPSFNIKGEDTVVANQTELVTVTNNPDVIYFWDINNGTIISYLSNDSASIQWGAPGIGYIKVVSANKYGCNSDTVTFQVIIGTNSLYDITQRKDIKISPNPASDFVNILSDEPVITEIYDIEGKNLLVSDKKVIDISDLSSGLYIILVKNREGVLVKIDRLVKE